MAFFYDISGISPRYFGLERLETVVSLAAARLQERRLID